MISTISNSGVGSIFSITFFTIPINGDVRFNAKNWLDPCSPRPVMKFHRRVEIAVISNGDRIHSKFRYPLHQPLYGVTTIEK